MLVPIVASTAPSWMRSVERLVVRPLLELHRLEQRQHGRRAVRAGGVDRALHPGAFREIDAVFVLQQPADEDGCRHRVEGDADALAFEILGLGDALLAVDADEGMAEAARRKHRDRNEGALLVGVALDVFGARILGDIEFLAARHAVEDGPGLLDTDEIEIDPVRLHLAGIDRLHAVIESGRKRQLQIGHWCGFPRSLRDAGWVTMRPPARK